MTLEEIHDSFSAALSAINRDELTEDQIAAHFMTVGDFRQVARVVAEEVARRAEQAVRL